MFINELSEPQLLVIYPGRFQPFHKGHHAVYEWLCGKFGRNNVYIATSNKTDSIKSPFTFGEKSYFMQLTGIAADRIVQATSPYQIDSVLASGQVHVENRANTVVVFAVSQKDMSENPRFASWSKKDGSPSYFQPLSDFKQAENMDQHGYIMTVPTFQFNVMGDPMQSSTELRAEYKVADEKTRQAIVADLFGRYTREAEQIMNAKLVPAAPVEQPKLGNKTKLQTVKTPKPTEEPVVEAGGTGVVASKKQARDPRYSMSLTRDVRPGQINKSLRAFDLAEDLAWVKSRLGEGAVDELTARHIEYINQDIAALKQRITTERLPANYVEAIKQKIAKLEQERAKLAFNPR